MASLKLRKLALYPSELHDRVTTNSSSFKFYKNKTFIRFVVVPLSQKSRGFAYLDFWEPFCLRLSRSACGKKLSAFAVAPYPQISPVNYKFRNSGTPLHKTSNSIQNSTNPFIFQGKFS
jgi:hypothetical protein